MPLFSIPSHVWRANIKMARKFITGGYMCQDVQFLILELVCVRFSVFIAHVNVHVKLDVSSMGKIFYVDELLSCQILKFATQSFGS